MTAHISHEEYVQFARRQVVEICSGILAGTVDLLQGCHLLASLRWDTGIDEWDPDFSTFVAISSEMDAMPVGEIRKHWAPEALARLEPDIQAAIEWASPQVLPACRSVVQRFGA